MKAVIALVLLGVVALSSAGLVSYASYPQVHLAAPYAVSPIGYSVAAPVYHTASNYRLHLDTSLPGSAYASYPNAAAPTAYGYGVVKTL